MSTSLADHLRRLPDESLAELLREEGKEVVPYLTGRKAAAFYQFRNRPVAEVWEGFSDSPDYAAAKEIAEAGIAAGCEFDRNSAGPCDIFTLKTKEKQ